MHELEGFVDVIEIQIVGDVLVDLDASIHVVVHQTRHLHQRCRLSGRDMSWTETLHMCTNYLT